MLKLNKSKDYEEKLRMKRKKAEQVGAKTIY
jgi:hypothetical protein